jgi:hypothetical protein
MKDKISGLAHCCHHDRHFEWCYDYRKRVDYIKRGKPVAEQELRLKLFQILPFDRLPLRLHEAWETHDKASKTYDKASKTYDKARETYDEARETYIEASEVCDEVLNNCMPELMKLHDELFPDCTWNEKQKTIFPIKGDKL